MFSTNNQNDQNILNGVLPVISTDNISDNYKNQMEKFSEEKLKFFRIFLWYIYSDIYNWKSLAHSIYHIEYLIKHLDNYQIKEFIQKQFEILLNYFIVFIKDLITIQIKSQKQNQSSTINDTLVSTNLETTFSEQNQIDEHLENLKTHIINLKELILTAKERFNLCKTDINAIETLLQAIENINLNSKNFDREDQNKIHLLSLKQDLSEKSTKNDLIQMKIYIDNQIKNLIELNKQNAIELERIKLLKTSTYQARHIQSILSTNPSSHSQKRNRMYSYQSSRPYITFELDHIRQYQRQALLKSPYGTIPLYRRQAWAAANLFPNSSLNFLHYMQNSLRMQIHDLLGYDPSDICNINKKKKINKKSNIEIFNRNKDITIVGNNNKLYRGRIDSCQIIPLKKVKENKLKIKSNIDENNENNQIYLDQFNQTNKTIIDEHLFEYLDWQTQFNEQDLPDELCEELFHHWISIVCDDQPPCICNSESKTILSNTQIDSPYDDRCMCSECSCTCEKYQDEKSICLCSQCSCKCLKDFSNKNEEIIEDIPEVYHQNSENDINIIEKIQSIPTEQIPIKENDIMISNCFSNRIDQWTQQFDIFPFSKKTNINTIFHSLELDDPIFFRQQILNSHQ